MSSGYSSYSWLSSDKQGYSPIADWNDPRVNESMSSLTTFQREFLHKKIESRHERHIYKKLLYRIEKYSIYKQTFPDYKEEQLKSLLDQSPETSIRYDDLYPMRRVSTNINSPPQLGVIDIPKVESDKLFVYDPKNSMCRLAEPYQVEFFTSILKSESSRIEAKFNNGSYYMITKSVWRNSVPMFIVFARERDIAFRYYFFYYPIHNNELLSTPLFYLQENPEDPSLYIMYNSNLEQVSKLTENLV